MLNKTLICLYIVAIAFTTTSAASTATNDVEAQLAFTQRGYNVGESATALVSVTNHTGKKIKLSKAFLVFKFLGTDKVLKRGLREGVELPVDRPAKLEVTLAPFDSDSPLGLYSVEHDGDGKFHLESRLRQRWGGNDVGDEPGDEHGRGRDQQQRGLRHASADYRCLGGDSSGDRLRPGFGGDLL